MEEVFALQERFSQIFLATNTFQQDNLGKRMVFFFTMGRSSF
jgi:hypothetical protein